MPKKQKTEWRDWLLEPPGERYLISPLHIEPNDLSRKLSTVSLGGGSCVGDLPEALETLIAILEYCREQAAENGGCWPGFMLEDISRGHFREAEVCKVGLGVLKVRGWLIQQGDLWMVTHRLAAGCFAASPDPVAWASKSFT